MHTIQAMKLIARAVQLADSGFEGDFLSEACKGADRLDKEMVCAMVRRQLEAQGKQHASGAALAEVIRPLAWT